MDFATIIGIMLGFGFIAAAIGLSGNMMGFVDLPSIAIVFGGTTASTLIMFPFAMVAGSFAVALKAFLTKADDGRFLVSRIVSLSQLARREGLVVLEKVDIGDPFLRKAVGLVADGSSPALVRSVMLTEINYMKSRHKRGQGVFRAMGMVSPAFGMIGTLIGLVRMLQTIEDVTTIGPAMAVALLTTFYGAVLANLVFIPIAKKLEERSLDESHKLEMIMEGVLSVQAGDHPDLVREKMNAFIAPRLRES